MKQVILSWRCIIAVLGSLLTLGGMATAQELHRIAYWRTHYQELLPQADPRAARAHEIFAQVLQVAGTPRGVVPRLLILKEDPWGIPLPVALQDGWIVASKGVLDFCYRVPRLGDDRLAFVLGHELAHLVQDHFWHLKFFQAMQASSAQMRPPSTQSLLPPENLQHQELQADTNGMIYAAMAGFNPQAIVTRDPAVNFFQEWIESREPNRMGRRPDIASHPTSQQRAEALTAALQRVVNQTVAFQIGLWLTYAGDYEQAIPAFEYFLELFPSREVYHNLGLSHHQLALQAYQVWKPDAPILPFHLPLILDPVTRASHIYLSAQAQRGGAQDAPQEAFHQHLEKAIERYRQAMEQHHEYLPSAINLANALIVRGVQSTGRGLFNADFVEAQAILMRAREAHPSDAQLLNTLGVALFYVERTPEAKTVFAQARTLAPADAAPLFNLKYLAERDPRSDEIQHYQRAYQQLIPPKKTMAAAADRQIEHLMNVAVGQFTDEVPTSWDQPTTSDVHLADRQLRVMMYPSGVMTLSQGDEILMLMAQQGFQQSSVKGIRIGSRAQDVRALYGEPSRRLDSPHGYNWSYDAHRIAFQLRHDRVMSWLVY
jgi:tetratricopeptide (TPR) repeat protein